MPDEVENPYEGVHYVTDGIAECARQAKEAAGGKDVMLDGAYTAQEALKAGVLEAVELEAPGTLHVRYDVQTQEG